MMNFLRSNNLAQAQSIKHGFFTRQGGVSEGAFASLNCSQASTDNPAHVAENRRRVAKEMGAEAQNFVFCRQVHSTIVHVVSEAWPSDQRPDGDAVVTTTPKILLGILTADCVPVLLADPKAKVVAAVHAGWRSAHGGIIKNTVQAMEKLGASRADLCAAIGPCIWQASYEVGAEFHESLCADDRGNVRFFVPAQKEAHFLFDLPCFVAQKLTDEEIRTVEPSPANTFTDEERFYSHRRGFVRGVKEEGRMVACIMID